MRCNEASQKNRGTGLRCRSVRNGDRRGTAGERTHVVEIRVRLSEEASEFRRYDAGTGVSRQYTVEVEGLWRAELVPIERDIRYCS